MRRLQVHFWNDKQPWCCVQFDTGGVSNQHCLMFLLHQLQRLQDSLIVSVNDYLQQKVLDRLAKPVVADHHASHRNLNISLSGRDGLRVRCRHFDPVVLKQQAPPDTPPQPAPIVSAEQARADLDNLQ